MVKEKGQKDRQWSIQQNTRLNSTNRCSLKWLDVHLLFCDHEPEKIKTSDYRFTDFWLTLYWLLITALLTSDYRFTDFWLPLYWPLITLYWLPITALLTSDYRFTDFWLPLYWLLITALLTSYKTWTLLQTTWGEGEPNIIGTCMLLFTIVNIKSFNR
jgi:hypothetical protein